MSKLQLRKRQLQLFRKLVILTGFLLLGLKALPQSNSSGISLSGSISTKNVNLNLKVGGSGYMQSDKADQTKESTGMRGGQQLQARLVDNTIQLSDGRIFTITSTTPRMGLHYTVDIREPANARVTLTFDSDKGTPAHTGTIPTSFKAYTGRSDNYYLMEVEEPSGATWSVKLFARNSQIQTIEASASGSGTVTISEPAVVTETYYYEEEGCQPSPDLFEASLANIEDEMFEEDRAREAKNILKTYCLNVSQLMELLNAMGGFEADDLKFQVATYAFREEKILDPENGIRIGRAFEDEFIREDWESFMDTQ